MKTRYVFLLLMGPVALASGPLRAETPVSSNDNWPAWRGPRGDGLSAATHLPVRWGPNEGVRWKTPLPGKGVSSPVVWGDRVFLTSSEGNRHDQLHVLCLDRRDGALVWDRRFWGTAPTRFHGEKSFMATSTPATDGTLVWAFFGTGDLFCLDFDGRLVWARSLAQEYEPFQNRFGMGSSPVLAGSTLVLQCDHWGQSYLLGVDKQTGENVWKTDRTEELGWSSPLVVDVDGEQQVVVSATFSVKGYDLTTGKELWVARGMSRSCIPTAVANDRTIFAVSGQGGQTMAIRKGGRGDITDSHVVWTATRGAPYVPSPLLVDGLYYLVEDGGIATCFDAETGARVWQKRLGAAYTASPVAGDGKIYLIDEAGTTTVLRPGREFEVIAKNELEEPVFASPAIAQGELFLRTAGQLVCVNGGGASASGVGAGR